jgi:hypothetical protein
MPGADAGSFAVTPDDLIDLAGRITIVRNQLQNTGGLVDGVADAMGSAEVVAALDHFVSGWRDGRKEITQEVDALSRMLSQAATVYYDTDSSLASAIPDAAP